MRHGMHYKACKPEYRIGLPYVLCHTHVLHLCRPHEATHTESGRPVNNASHKGYVACVASKI